MSGFNESDGTFTGFIISVVAWKRCTCSWRFCWHLSYDKCMTKVRSLSSPTLKSEGRLWNAHSITRWCLSMFHRHLPNDRKLNSWRKFYQSKRTILIILTPTGGGCHSSLWGRHPLQITQMFWVICRFEVLLLILGKGRGLSSRGLLTDEKGWIRRLLNILTNLGQLKDKAEHVSDLNMNMTQV